MAIGAMAGGASLRVEVSAARQVGRRLGHHHHLVLLYNLIAQRLGLAGDAGRRGFARDFVSQRIDLAGEILVSRVGAQLFGGVLDEADLLAILGLRENLSLRADGARVVTGDVVQQRDRPPELLRICRHFCPRGRPGPRNRNEIDNENHSQHRA